MAVPSFFYAFPATNSHPFEVNVKAVFPF